MPDIMMCANAACPSAETCYRHRATPGYWQSWGIDLAPDESGRCREYMPIGGWGNLRPFVPMSEAEVADLPLKALQRSTELGED